MRPLRGSAPRKVLAVFPHPDDEAVTCGGTLRRFSKSGANVSLVLLTGGERGNPSGAVDIQLSEIRRREAQRAAAVLGVSRLIHANFEDGNLAQQRDRVAAYLSQLLEDVQPDLVITYDAAGLDGHPDHIACSEILTELRRTRFQNVRLWYVALPQRMIWLLTLARQMRHVPSISSRRARPTHALFVAANLPGKLSAVRAYRSQHRALGKGLGRLLPAWLIVGLNPLECFSEVD